MSTPRFTVPSNLVFSLICTGETNQPWPKCGKSATLTPLGLEQAETSRDIMAGYPPPQVIVTSRLYPVMQHGQILKDSITSHNVARLEPALSGSYDERGEGMILSMLNQRGLQSLARYFDHPGYEWLAAVIRKNLESILGTIEAAIEKDPKLGESLLVDDQEFHVALVGHDVRLQCLAALLCGTEKARQTCLNLVLNGGDVLRLSGCQDQMFTVVTPHRAAELHGAAV